MTITEWIFAAFNAKEVHELPAKMMPMLLDDEKREQIAQDYIEQFPDISHDYMRDFFEESVANRKTLKQDYTPDGICQIVAALAGHPDRCADVCAGTGALTIGLWKESPQTHFTCYEISSAAVPFLLLNLTVRKARATVVHGDVLTEEVEQIYEIENGKITLTDVCNPDPFPVIISNPPYSLSYSGTHDLRFGSYATPPKSKADYAFVLIALSMMKPDGRLIEILPHGTLFRSAAEGIIRKQLIQDRMYSTVIGVAPALFQETTIPVHISIFQKSEDGVYFVDASRIYKKVPKQNVLEAEHITKIKSAAQLRMDVERLSHLASFKELEENDFNMNIPRYVDSSEPEPKIDIMKILDDLILNKKDIYYADQQIDESLTHLADTTGDPEWKTIQNRFHDLFET